MFALDWISGGKKRNKFSRKKGQRGKQRLFGFFLKFHQFWRKGASLKAKVCLNISVKHQLSALLWPWQLDKRRNREMHLLRQKVWYKRELKAKTLFILCVCSQLIFSCQTQPLKQISICSEDSSSSNPGRPVKVGLNFEGSCDPSRKTIHRLPVFSSKDLCNYWWWSRHQEEGEFENDDYIHALRQEEWLFWCLYQW